MTTVARVAWTIPPFLAACVLFPPALAAPGHTPDSTVETVFQNAVPAADHSVAPNHAIAGGEEEAVDLYGNEVSAAMSTYKLDEAGSLYEVHSPQTAMPTLPPPKS